PAPQAAHRGRGMRCPHRPEAVVSPDLLPLPHAADGAARPGHDPDFSDPGQPDRHTLNTKEPDMPSLTLFARLALLCTGATLAACAPFGARAVFNDAAPAAADAYLSGRNHHLARRYDEARAAYQAALLAAPGHVNARNGLATLYAEQREFNTAIALWRELTDALTLSSGPGKAYLFSNLGHAYFLKGEYDNALVALEKACLLDPLNHRSWQLLGDTLRKLGQEERAQQ